MTHLTHMILSESFDNCPYYFPQDKPQQTHVRLIVQPGSLSESMAQQQLQQVIAPELGPVVSVSTFSYEDPHSNQHGVRLVLECLRDIGMLCLPCQVRISCA